MSIEVRATRGGFVRVTTDSGKRWYFEDLSTEQAEVLIAELQLAVEEAHRLRERAGCAGHDPGDEHDGTPRAGYVGGKYVILGALDGGAHRKTVD